MTGKKLMKISAMLVAKQQVNLQIRPIGT